MSKILGDNQVTVVDEESVLPPKRGKGQRGLEPEGISLRDSEAIEEEGGNKTMTPAAFSRLTPAVLEESSPWIFLPADFFNFFSEPRNVALYAADKCLTTKLYPTPVDFFFFAKTIPG